MNNLLIYFPPFVISFLLCWLFSGWIKKAAIKFKLLPVVRSRDVHKQPVPRVGGIAIFLSFVIVSLVWFFLVIPWLNIGQVSLSDLDRKFWGLIIAGILIAGSMLLDDVKGLKAPTKLIIQVSAALIIIVSGVGIDYIANPFGPPINLNAVYIPFVSIDGVTYHFSLWSDLLTLVWLVGMMNVINFIDGIDGLAAGISGIAALTIFLLSLTVLVNQPATALIAIVLAGAAFGFLPINFYPAKLIMGDSGSMFLGLMLGVLPLISGGKLATAGLVLGFPIVDGLMVTLGRLLKGKNPMTTPDKTHLHHRFISAGFSTRQSVVIMYVIAAAFGWVALRSTTQTKIEAGLVLVILLVVMILFLSYQKKQNSN